MINMRKGFSLVELLVVVVVLPFVFLLFDGLFKTIIGEIPMSVRLIQENTSLLSVLRHIQQDIDRAKGLPKSFAGQIASDQILLIELSEGIICYQLKDGQVVRQKLTDTPQSKAEEPRVWSIPHARVEWKVWERNGQGYAVETNTHLEYGRKGQWKKKMAHTHLYFAGALGKELR
ncbi:MAG: prepilin-type N-terminal cleavage/methylation domain-containing protein [Sedimentisphaerales bacterium]